MKKSNNKGFSLVELIVVVAIMAVLVGVLAPAYLKYVENSRIKKDCNNAEEVRHAVEIALADEKVFESIPATGLTVTVADETAIACDDSSALLAEVTDTVGSEIDFVSKKYNGQTYTINVSVSGTKVTVTGDNWS